MIGLLCRKTMGTLFIKALLAHLIADFFLQNEWMALKKTSLRHPASWVHSGIHLVALLLVFAPGTALLIALSHLLIDTRKPLQWWRTLYRQSNPPPIPVDPAFICFAMWQDQAAHIVCLCIAVLMS